MNDDPEHYRLRAEELRTIADGLGDESCAAILRRIAEENEKRAEQIETKSNP
jgi:hypothetical protein